MQPAATLAPRVSRHVRRGRQMAAPEQPRSWRTYISGETSVLRRTKLRFTGWGSNPGGVDIFRTCLDRPWGPPSFLYTVHRVFPGGKAAGTWCWPPIHFYRRCCECVKPYLGLPAVFSCAFHGVIFKTEVGGGLHVPAAVPHMNVTYFN